VTVLLSGPRARMEGIGEQPSGVEGGTYFEENNKKGLSSVFSGESRGKPKSSLLITSLAGEECRGKGVGTCLRILAWDLESVVLGRQKRNLT